jgi:hypothetical protein
MEIFPLELISWAIYRKIGVGVFPDSKDQFIKHFFKNEINAWILKVPNVGNAIRILLNTLDKETIRTLSGKEIGFVTCQGLWASTINPQKNLFLILVFPNLLELFDSPKFLLGVAVLAHEIGHIFCDHSKRKLSPMEEQFEADSFAARIGFKNELIDFLSMYPNSTECKIRKERLIKEAIRPRLIP